MFFAGILTEVVGGAVSWDHVLNAIAECEGQNYYPTALVGSPVNYNLLRQLKSGDGANSAALYLEPPPAAKDLMHFSTSSVGDADMLLGDFSKYIIGLRAEARVEFSGDADEAFDRHQVKIRIVWRGAFTCERPTAFCHLTTIS